MLSLGALFGLIALAAHLARDPLDALGRGFVQRFGLAGMFVGTYLADAFSFPIPPQFYMQPARSEAAEIAIMGASCGPPAEIAVSM